MKTISAFTATARNLPHWQSPGSVYFVTWRTRQLFALTPDCRSIVLNAVKHWHTRRWFVYATVVMPDHVHVLARPLSRNPNSLTDTEVHDLGAILHSIKGFSAHCVNGVLGRVGSVWQDERYDRIIRDDREFDETAEYIRHNPEKAGLVAAGEGYPWYFQATG